MYTKNDLRKLPALGRAAGPAFDAFMAFDRLALQDGAIPAKYKELMAVAVALTTQCPYCITIHREKAIALGATEQELAEATMVSAALRAGAAVTHGTHLLAD